MDVGEILAKIGRTEAPLARQMLMTELLIVRYRDELDWAYLERRAALPENDTLEELRALRDRRAL